MLCTICARSGSKSVPNKNLRLVAGKPLLAHSIGQALQARLFDAIAFSSDSEAYLHAAKQFGASIVVRRPDELASDSAGKIPAIRHCVLEAEAQLGRRADIIIDLDCTSPLRQPTDIRKCVELLLNSHTGNVITAAPARRSPYFNLIERRPDGRIDLAKRPSLPIIRRQDAPECYDMNASIYGWRREALFDREGLFHPDTALYLMPEERSLDIDSELDFELVSILMERRAAQT